MDVIERADVVFLILSGPDQLTTQEEKIAAQIIQQNKAYGIFINKWDLCEKGNEARKLARENLLYKAPFLRFADVFFISALERKGLHKILTQARHLAGKIRHEYTEEELTRAYQVISSHHSEVGAKGHFLELKRLSAYPRQNKSPIFKVKCNRPHLVTSAYAKYWKNALVDFFGLRGIPIEVRFRQK
jgi:GTP-binding protein